MIKREIDFVSLLGKDCVVADGNIVVPSNLKISGFVKMNIESKEKVVVTESGTVEGNIIAESVQIHGKVTGSVKANRTVIIHKTGVISGFIQVDALTIEEGACCNIDTVVGKEAQSGNAANGEKANSGSGNKTRTTNDKPDLSHSQKQDADHSEQGEKGLMSSTNGRNGVHQSKNSSKQKNQIDRFW